MSQWPLGVGGVAFDHVVGLRRSMAAKACNSSGTALVVASQRLKETKENVSQQLKAAEDRVKSLCRKRTDLSSRLSMECDSVEQQIHLLKQMLDEKKIDCVKQLKMKRSEELDSLSANIEQIEMVISKTVQVSIYETPITALL